MPIQQVTMVYKKEGCEPKPISFYHVGDNVNKSKDTILFVGKTAIGNDLGELNGDYHSPYFLDATKFGLLSLCLKEKYAMSRAFYSYTHEIIKSYFGSFEVGIKHVAMTNMVKCNNGSTLDINSYLAKKTCIDDLGLIWQEIEMINPRRVVFYTNHNYNEFIERYKPKSDDIKIEDITHQAHRVKLGSKKITWWHRRFLDKNNVPIMDFLIVGHPMMKHKTSYVQAIISWLREN